MDEPKDQEIENRSSGVAGSGETAATHDEGHPEEESPAVEEVSAEGEGHTEEESSRRLTRRIKESLAGAGITLENLGELTALCGDAASRAVKVVAVPLGLREGIDELNTNPRDRVVMVRVDKDTSEALDAWVQTGALKSRSEAAALFMNEGLKIRTDELSQLWDGLRDVEEAKRRLHERAREVLGNVTGEELSEEPTDEPPEDSVDKGDD